MTGESLKITQDNLDKFQSLFPDIFSEGKIDMEKFKATFSDDINFANERYVLNWAGKSDAFKVLQIPTTATLKPQPEQSINFDTTENVFIEGENLEVLKVLQKSYYGKIKVIEIDPPYNTGSDSFIYPDSFKENKAEYEKRVGDKDEEGYLMKEGMFRKNSKDSGHFHSNWLSMMYPRLFLAKNLLKEEGVIFIHIDDNEVHNLRLLMNEIFGEENFIAQFIWKSRQNKDNRNLTGASIDHEYVLCYGKRIRGAERKVEQYKNPDNDSRGAWVSGNMVGLLPQELRPNCHYDLINPETGINYGKPKLGWRYDKYTMSRLIQEKRIIFPDSPEGRPRKKVFLNELTQEFTGFSSIIGEKLFTRNGTAEIEELFGFRAFDFPKPSELIKELISQSVDENDIVLDFFGGSASTAHAAIKWNLKETDIQIKFILVQLPELCNENSEAYKAGYKTIAEISKERIRRVVANINKRKQYLESCIANENNIIEVFNAKLSELKVQNPQLFETEKEIPEIENIKKQIEELNTNLERYTEELDKINASDLGFKYYKLTPSNFKIWRGNEITEENLVTQLDAFTNPVKAESKKENMLYELIIKAGYLLTDKVEVKEKFFSVKNGELIIALEEMNQQILDNIIKAQPQKVITLDNLFTGNDQLKTNTVLQMKDLGIELKTI